jgi:hypothetical protein
MSRLWIEFPVKDYRTGEVHAAVVSGYHDHLTRFKWSVNNRGYVSRKVRAKRYVRPGCSARTLLLHRVVMGVECDPAFDWYHVDHINGDPLDNRAENLRVVTPEANEELKHRRIAGEDMNKIIVVPFNGGITPLGTEHEPGTIVSVDDLEPAPF